MKKILSALTLIGFLSVTLAPAVALAQAEPVKCVKLGADIKWTGNIGTKNCTTGAYKYCLFKSGKAVGEEIKTGDCGNTGADVSAQCDGAVWTDRTTYWEQNAHCLTNSWGVIALLNSINVAANWIFVILMIVVGLLVIWGAFQIVTAAGAPEKVTSGRNYIVYALIGLAVALLARALPSIVSALLGV